MGMGGMDHGAMSHGSMQEMDHGSGTGGMDGMSHDMRDKSLVPPDVKVGVGVDMIAPMPVDRTGDRPLGLEDVPHRVLTYHDLAPLTPFHDTREPPRSGDIPLPGNMERFLLSFAGTKMNEGADPNPCPHGEPLRR